MDLVKSVTKNTFYLMAGDVVSKAVSFFVSVAFVRHLGSESLGEYAIAMAYVYFFAALPYFSHEAVLGRELVVAGEKEGPRILAAGILLRLLFSVAAVAAALAGLCWFSSPREIEFLIWIVSFGILASFRALFVAVFQKRMEMGRYVLATTFMNFAAAAGTLALIAAGGRVVHFVFFNTAMCFAVAAVYWQMARRRTAVVWRGCLRFVPALFKDSFPMAVGHFFDRVLARWDQMMVFTFAGTVSLGLYSVCVTLNEALLFIPVSLATTLLPVLSSFFVSAKDRLLRSVRLGGKYLAMAALPAATGLSFYSAGWVSLVFGAGYSGAEKILAILAWALPFLFFLAFARQVLLSVRRQNAVLWATLAGAAANVALNLAWAPRWGAQGAAWATVVSQAATFAAFFADGQARPAMIELLRGALRTVPASAGMAAVSFFLREHWLVSFAIASAAYAALLILTRALDREDWKLWLRVREGARG